MTRNTILAAFLILSSILFQNCGNKNEQTTQQTTEPQPEISSVKTDTITTEKVEEKNLPYTITVETIDSTAYHSAKGKNSDKGNNLVKITDFKEAKKLLKGIVDFNENDKDNIQAVTAIHFRNGKKIGNSNDFDYYYFVAYYPEEDILLCEGGHTTDVSFNLTNGKETEETGNPDEIRFSPQNKVRLNGHFGGQECYSYFIEKKINNEYTKIIQLDEEFEKLTKIWLCTIGNSFWTDEETLYLTETDGYAENSVNIKYFKIKIIQ
ncbi:hypothetical protein [Flavobacterium hercynium]|uniref:Lipoprotein n=1 Tax=Flavobacterium hercynium TaxID=387094 RepID=A0A226HPA0_9FLAO|nr:hypothetical protein [Flavobacterium hercynium]OXA96097.1 hypothetical protein B0A66_00510 [Flavobacterium hercynium]SMP06284.1 hypothetical protein SAMN06265346_101611 [Flavobacterium hercynium]